MASLSSLNTYSSEDINCSVDTQTVRVGEGDVLEMPMMAWYPIHDLGNTLLANGITVTHTFADPTINMSDGNVFTVAQYEAYIANARTYSNAVVSGATVDTAKSYRGLASWDMTTNDVISVAYSGTDWPVGAGGAYTWEAWLYVDNFTTTFARSITTLLQPNGRPALSVSYRRGQTYESDEAIYVQLPSTTRDVFSQIVEQIQYAYIFAPVNTLADNNWHHLAIVRNGGEIRVYQDGVRLLCDYVWLVTGQVLQSNATITDTTNIGYGARFRLNGPFPTDASRVTAGFEGWYNQVKHSNVAQYTANFTPPAVWQPIQANCAALLMVQDNEIRQVQQMAYPLNRAIDWSEALDPYAVLLDRLPANSNITIDQTSANSWQIEGIRTPEDYLLGAGFLHFSANYSGAVGNSEPSYASGSWTTNIRNSAVSTYDYTYIVNCEFDDSPPFTPSSIAAFPYDWYGANITVIDNVETAFDINEVALLNPQGTPETGTYVYTIDTQSHPSRFILASTSGANVNPQWGYSPGTTYGRLTLTGTRSDINNYLAGLYATKNSGVIANAHPMQHTVQSISIDGAGNQVPQFQMLFNGDSYAGNPNAVIRAYSPYTTGGYCLFLNDFFGATGLNLTRTTTDFLVGNAACSNTWPTSSENFDICAGYITTSDPTWGTGGTYSGNWTGVRDMILNNQDWTHEFWLNPWEYTSATITGNSYVARAFGMNIAIWDKKIWALPLNQGESTNSNRLRLPNDMGDTTSTNTYPRRIVNSTTLSPGTWYHIAVGRYNGEYFLYVNGQDNNTYYSYGQSTTTRAGSSTWQPRGDGMVWGGMGYAGNSRQVGAVCNYYRLRPYIGWITDIRISGIARYTTTFTPATTPLINDADTFFLCNFEGGDITDDFVLPEPGIGKLTWSFTHANAAGTIQSDYYPNFFAPFTQGQDLIYDSTYEQGVSGGYRYRLAYAGKDAVNNPVWAYAYRDANSLMNISAIKVDANVGGILSQQTRLIPDFPVANAPLQCASEAEQAGLGSFSSGFSNVWISGITGNVTADQGAPLLFSTTFNLGTGDVILGNTESAQSSVTRELSLYVVTDSNNPNVAIPGIASANTTNMTDYPGLGRVGVITISANTNANISTAVSAVGWDTISSASPRYRNHAVFGYGPFGSATMKLLRYSAPTQFSAGGVVYVQYAPTVTSVMSGAGAPWSDTQIALLCDNNDTISTRLFMFCVENISGTYRMNMQVMESNGTLRSFETGLAWLGGMAPADSNTFPAAVSVVPGPNRNTAYLVYNQGQSGGGATGLFYIKLTIADNGTISWGSWTTIESTDSGRVFNTTWAMRGTNIGSNTYIAAVIPRNDTPVDPYVFTYKIPYTE
jgi:hypothetical protein